MMLMLTWLTVSVAVNLWLLVLWLTKHRDLAAVLRTALRKAELDRAGMVRVPYNQVAELMGWRSEFYPHRDAVGQAAGPHPARLSPWRRHKLAR